MQDHGTVISFESYLGVDLWRKNLLWVPQGGMPASARFLCAFELVFAIDEVEIECFVNRPGNRVLEIWTGACGERNLLSRSKVDKSADPAEQYIQGLLAIFKCWSEFNSIGELTRAGLIGTGQWQKLKLRLESALRPKAVCDVDDRHGLLHMASTLGLEPWHKGGDSELFICSCPGYWAHHCYLHPGTGHWYCGWCPRGGDTPEALRDFYQESRE